MATFDGIPILGDLEKEWNENAVPFFERGWEESKVPIWDRQTTKDAFGEEAADNMQDVLNPARWIDNAIDETVPEPLRDVTKKAVPIAAIGGAALLALLILKAKF